LAIQGGDVSLVVDAGVTAERSGFDSVWSMEYYNRSAIVTLAALASTTTRIALGSGVAWAFGRSPLTLATDARSLDDLSGGRFSLGIGTGSPQSMSDWHGVSEPHPAPRAEEFVHLVREIWQLHEQPVDHDGRFYQCHLAPDPSARPLTHGTMRVLMAGVQPPMLRAAGAAADGLVGHPLFTRRYVEEVVRPSLAAGADRAQRDESVPISGMIICAVADDAAAARRAAATQIAAYATRKASDALLDFNGYTAETAAIREAFALRDFPAMIAAVSDRMLDETAVFGTAKEAVERYRERFESLYEQPILYSPNTALPAGYLRDNIHAICETFAFANA
jgi:alkanesulfonate monooxygenase SsuD/methylene tetrahydromethanopterin reductase-like flavin-dependent oxidoreductase (luciferase family)